MNASANSPWKLEGSSAKLNCGVLQATLDVSRPQVGLHLASFDYGRVPCNLLSLSRAAELDSIGLSGEELDNKLWPLSLSEVYVRGNDLVASYSPATEWPYAPQLYWSANTLTSIAGVLGSISQLVSVQTHLLDTHPKVNVHSQLPSSDYRLIAIDDDEAKVEPMDTEHTLQSTNGTFCILLRSLARQISYVEIVESTDFQELTYSPVGDGRLFATWRLFAEFLEKGVIRKARVHGAFIERENDCEIAIECCRAIEHSPLPLTT